MNTSLVVAKRSEIGLLDLRLELRLQIYHEYGYIQPARHPDQLPQIFRNLLGFNQQLRSELLQHLSTLSETHILKDEVLDFCAQPNAGFNIVRFLQLELLTLKPSSEPVMTFHTEHHRVRRTANVVRTARRMTNLKRVEIICYITSPRLRCNFSPINMNPLFRHPRLESIALREAVDSGLSVWKEGLLEYEKRLNVYIANRKVSA